MSAFLEPVRAAYDAMADDYTARFGTSVAEGTDEDDVREFVTALAGPGPVLDVGCGAGRTTAFLAELGTAAAGLDLSASMLRHARRANPGPPYLLGSMTALPVADGGLAGLLAWYSVIHVAPAVLPLVFGEFHRVLRPGGRLVLGFQSGDEISHHDRPFGHDTPLDFQRYRPDDVADLLAKTGFEVTSLRTRDPHPAEPTPQGFVTATRPPGREAEVAHSGPERA